MNFKELLESKKKFTKEKASKIAKKLNIDFKKFNFDQFLKGMNVELEHGTIDSATDVTDDDCLKTGKIALAHLKEIPDYYNRLDKMEKKAKD